MTRVVLSIILTLAMCGSVCGDDSQTIRTSGPATVIVTTDAPETGRRLPLCGCWNTGENQQSEGQDVGYTPDFQLSQIQAGVPWQMAFEWFDDFGVNVRANRSVYFEPAWGYCRDNRAPISFVGRNFIDIFRLNNQWGSATPPVDHPFLVKADGTIVKTASPWSPNIHQWYALGSKVGAYLAVEFAADYPNPPEVWLFDNNEAGYTKQVDSRQDARYPTRLVDAFATMNSVDALAVESVEYQRAMRLRYAEFRRGLRDALPEGWKKIRFVGYSPFGNEFGMAQHDPDPLRFQYPWYGEHVAYTHDGVTCNVGYLQSWSSGGAGIVRSPQMEAGNVRFAREQFQRDFSFETHYWNGKGVPKDVWQGVIRCTLWQMLTERNRMFLGSSLTRASTYDRDMQPLEQACREVKDSQILSRFWKHGTLLRNVSEGHPYIRMMQPEFTDLTKRMFIQHVPANNRVMPWNQFTLDPGPDARLVDTWTINRSMTTPIAVYAIALKDGSDTLIYAHAPNGAMNSVEIQVCPTGSMPDFSVTVDVPVSGAFWVRYADGSVSAL